MTSLKSSLKQLWFGEKLGVFRRFLTLKYRVHFCSSFIFNYYVYYKYYINKRKCEHGTLAYLRSILPKAKIWGQNDNIFICLQNVGNRPLVINEQLLDNDNLNKDYCDIDMFYWGRLDGRGYLQTVLISCRRRDLHV